MNEIVKPAAQWLSQHIGWTAVFILFFFSLFFEFSKIKLSPITTFLKWIGERLTGGLRQDIADLKEDTNEKIADLKADTEAKIAALDHKTSATLEEIKTNSNYNCKETQAKLEEIERKQDLQAVSRIKAHVLNFSRSLRIGNKHTEEDFKNLIKENEEYEAIVNKHGWSNNVYKADYAYFYKEFERCQEENDFLGGTYV